MNEITEEARTLGTAATQAGTRVDTKVSAPEDKSIATICPTCGTPLTRGSFNRWKMQWAYWCLNEECPDHMSPVRVPV